MVTRTIGVSTNVYALIWAARQDGEESEDAILSRLLGRPIERQEQRKQPSDLASQPMPQTAKKISAGYIDEKSGVTFAEGEEIFRVYRGKEYRARATQGAWLLLNDRRVFPSLNKLSWAVVRGSENAWSNWKFKSAEGKIAFINSLRPDEKVQRRNNDTPDIDMSKLSLEDLGL